MQERQDDVLDLAFVVHVATASTAHLRIANLAFDTFREAYEDDSTAAPIACDAVIPDTDLRRVRRWAAQRVPPHARHQVRLELEVSDRAITIVERRPPWREDFGPDWTSFPIARLRFTKSRNEWTLYWRDRHLRFHRYEDAPPTPHIVELIAVVDDNRTGIFWG